jgi:rhamnosyltransferase
VRCAERNYHRARSEENYGSNGKYQMMVSVVLLTYNGGEALKRAIRVLQNQHTTFEVELIAVDSQSSDDTVAFLTGCGVRVVVIPRSTFEFGHTRDFAFGLAHGDVIVTQSQDVIPKSDTYLAKLCAPILNREAEVVQGRTEPPSDQKNVFVWHRKPELFYFTAESEEFNRQGFEIGLSCVCLAMTNRAWQNTGFKGSPYCEDKLMERRLKEKRFKVVQLPEAIAWHGHDYNLVGLIRRCYNEGVGWHYAEVRYSIRNLLRDLMRGFTKYRPSVIKAIRTGEARNFASAFFFQIRPICFFIGNRMVRKVWLETA